MIRKSTWMLLGVFALLLVSVFLWNRVRNSQDINAESESQMEFFFDLREGQIVGLEFSSVDSSRVVMQKNVAGDWMFVEPEYGNPDLAQIESLLFELASFRVISTVSSQLEKNVIGLAPPQYTLNVELNTGELIQAFFGDETPTQGGYYAYREGQSILVVNGLTVENLINLISSPPVKQTLSPDTGG
jgi:hypothetical protein